MASSYKRIAGQQHADSGLGAIVARADLVKLCDRLACFFELSQFQISFRQQVEILRLVRMLLDLLDQFGQVQLRALLRSKVGAIV